MSQGLSRGSARLGPSRCRQSHHRSCTMMGTGLARRAAAAVGRVTSRCGVVVAEVERLENRALFSAGGAAPEWAHARGHDREGHAGAESASSKKSPPGQDRAADHSSRDGDAKDRDRAKERAKDHEAPPTDDAPPPPPVSPAPTQDPPTQDPPPADDHPITYRYRVPTPA